MEDESAAGDRGANDRVNSPPTLTLNLSLYPRPNLNLTLTPALLSFATGKRSKIKSRIKIRKRIKRKIKSRICGKNEEGRSAVDLPSCILFE
jgi:hypothetical protein